MTLRPLTEEDYSGLYEVASDPLLWEQHPHHNRHEQSEFRKFFADAMASNGALVAVEPESGDVIGSSRLFPYENEQARIEIGWSFLARSHWGGRFNGQMKALMIRHVLATFEEVFFRVGATNLRSQKAVEKLGVTNLGTHINPQGVAWVHYSMDRDGFARLEATQ